MRAFVTMFHFFDEEAHLGQTDLSALIDARTMTTYAAYGAEIALKRALECDVVVVAVPGTCGNVGQLACDVLAATYNLARVGAVDFEHLPPVCGRDALYDDLSRGSSASGMLASACEIYCGTIPDEDMTSTSGRERSACVVQIRSDAHVGARRAFCDELAKFVAGSFTKATRIVMCSSLPSTVAESAEQIGGTKWRRCRGNDAFNTACDAIELVDLEMNVRPSEEEMSTSVNPHWALMDALDAVDGEKRVGCVLAICSEGENTVDGCGMAHAVAKVCGIKVSRPTEEDVKRARSSGSAYDSYMGPWRVPRSWNRLDKHRHDVYG